MPLKPFDLPLLKVEATGNDFVLIDLLDSSSRSQFQTAFTGQPRSAWVRKWCDRRRGIGADGAVFLEVDPLLDFKWDFFNSDGSPAEMCGNAARAVTLYMSQKTGKGNFTFSTKAGEIRSQMLSNGQIEIEMPAIKDFEWDIHTAANFDFVKAGVPHAVVEKSSLSDLTELKSQALAVKSLSRFSISGTNVTFVKKISPHHIETLTFERGVEDFTLSCGTGAVAAAYAFLRGREGKDVQVDVPGGTLYVVFRNGKPFLKGPAQITAEAKWFA